jgi:hypothetical protein
MSTSIIEFGFLWKIYPRTNVPISITKKKERDFLMWCFEFLAHLTTVAHISRFEIATWE